MGSSWRTASWWWRWSRPDAAPTRSTPVGDTAFPWAASFSPHDEFVVYREPIGVFEPERLLLVDVDNPGEALEVLSDSFTWQFVSPE